MTVENQNQSKTKAITKPIRDASKTMSNQSQVRAKPNAIHRFGFGFTRPIRETNKRNRVFTFDSHLKTALNIQTD